MITFNQPEKRNAISLAMWEGLAEALALSMEDESIKVVVLKGAGVKTSPVPTYRNSIRSVIRLRLKRRMHKLLGKRLDTCVNLISQ